MSRAGLRVGAKTGGIQLNTQYTGNQTNYVENRYFHHYMSSSVAPSALSLDQLVKPTRVEIRFCVGNFSKVSGERGSGRSGEGGDVVYAASRSLAHEGREVVKSA